MKILMVCLGNICRSPLAEGIMQHVVGENDLGWEVRSAGTGNWHVGKEPDHRSISVAKQHGIDISNQRAQHFTPVMFDDYDRIFVMDHQNLEDVLAQAVNDEQKKKVALFLPNAIVPDPYFDDKMFTPVFHLIEERCRQLWTELIK